MLNVHVLVAIHHRAVIDPGDDGAAVTIGRDDGVCLESVGSRQQYAACSPLRLPKSVESLGIDVKIISVAQV